VINAARKEKLSSKRLFLPSNILNLLLSQIEFL
jgi:hypothetical protein